MMLAEHRAIAERGGELVEFRIDYLSHLPDLQRLLAKRPTPVIITCRRAQDKGNWKGTEEQRLTLLRSAIVAGVDYVDLEEDVAAAVPRYGSTKRIVSYHNFDETPANLEEIHARLCGLNADIVKLATMANSPNDNIRMLRLVQQAKVPTVGFCMGDLGTISRILTGRFGAPFSFATFNKERALAPGQLSFEEMKDLYRYDSITPATKIYGVVGDPIGHSLSPHIHNPSFAKIGMDAVYVPFRIPKGTLHATLEQYRWLDVQGYSVTIPHKEALVEESPNYDGPIEKIGAANTLYRDEHGVWRIANTDCEAAIEAIVLGLKALHAGPESDEELAVEAEISEGGKVDPTEPEIAATDVQLLAGKRVLILGAGGVARAVGMGLVQAGAAVVVSNRSKTRGAELAQHLGCQHILWENRGTVFADVVVNCTSVGMHPQVDESPFAENWLREGTVVFDTVYNPENTLLIKQARERGCQVVTGVEMFVRQAARQFALFTGTPAPFETMRGALRQAISPVHYSVSSTAQAKTAKGQEEE